jgi:hypothetical protein
MKKFLIFVGMTVGGWVGWVAAERWGIMAAFIVSTLGSLVGVIIAWKIGRNYFA